VGAGVRGRLLSVALAALVVTTWVAVTAGGALGVPFVQGENLPACSDGAEGRSAGDYVVVSRDGNTAAWEGCVYAQSEGTWKVQAELTGITPIGITDDGNLLLNERGATKGNVFVRSGESWTFQGEEVRADAVSGDGGTAVTLKGKEVEPNVFKVVAVVYSISGETWSEQAELIDPTPAERHNRLGTGFGDSISLSDDGSTMIVGAPGVGKQKGAAYVYTRTGESWTLQATLKGAGMKGKAQFGERTALSEDGRTALIGGPWDRGAHGAAWTFAYSGGIWTQQAKLISRHVKKESFFGDGLALSSDGQTALVGGAAEKPGVVGVFERSATSWSEVQTLTPSDANTENWFGRSLALSGDGNTALIFRVVPQTVFEPKKPLVTVWTR
jgi:hypothetical protein